MSQLNRIVNISISLSSPVVTQAAFAAALILGKFTYFTDDAKEYSSTADMLVDGFLTTDPEYLAAVDYFAQRPQPQLLVLGRRAMTRTLTITPFNSFLYTVTIAGVVYSYQADGSATDLEIQAGLIAAINAATSTHHLTASASSTDVVILTPANGVCPTVAVSAHLVKADGVVVDTIADDLGRIQRANAAWYGIVLADRDNTNASSVASWTESSTVPHMFIYASADTTITDSSGETASLPYLWKAAGYTKSVAIFHALAATRYPDAAIFGRVLPKDPGSYTVKFQTLTGIPASNLTDSQISVAAAKNCNVYISVAGSSFVQEGKVVSGEYIDVMIFIDWLQAKMTERIFARLVSADKTAFTDAGLQSIGGLVKAQLQDGITVGGLASTPVPVVVVPAASSFSSATKATRTANGITFSATLAGAIHFVGVTGVVTA